MSALLLGVCRPFVRQSYYGSSGDSTPAPLREWRVGNAKWTAAAASLAPSVSIAFRRVVWQQAWQEKSVAMQTRFNEIWLFSSFREIDGKLITAHIANPLSPYLDGKYEATTTVGLMSLPLENGTTWLRPKETKIHLSALLKVTKIISRLLKVLYVGWLIS